MEFPLPCVSRVVPTSVPAVPEAEITAVFSYSLADPYAVNARFATADGEVDWAFARDLLKDGLRETVGLGDIRVRPGSEDSVWITLRSAEGSAELECDRSTIEEFVQQIFAAVPSGTESGLVHVESWIEDLISSH